MVYMTTVYKNKVQSHQHPSADVAMYGSMVSMVNQIKRKSSVLLFYFLICPWYVNMSTD